MTEPRIRAYLAMTADGFIADANGDVGWLEGFTADVGFQEFFDSVDVIVSGRKTYEQVLGFGEWPYAGKRVVVLSHSDVPSPGIAGVEFSSGGPAQLAARLRAEAKGDIWLLGGGDLVRRFLAAKAVDTLELYVMPLLLGSGVPLFVDGGPEVRLELEQCAAYDQGMVALIYKVI